MDKPKAKIPCSVSIITRGEGLQPVLEALQDFEEVIICHGNPPQEQLEVAHEFGAVLLPQYDTDESNITCVMDKAAVRERAMNASMLPWRFFMDRDDRLSREAIEEIRTITTMSHPTHLVWRMPTRIFIAGKEILHEATYPSYQTRLVHESVGAHFRGPVHERLVFDTRSFPVGTMHSYYDFHWSPERVKNYWSYLHSYVVRELQTTTFTSFGNFLYWGIYRRARTILGYLLWRLPAMYLRYGFKDSMPLSIELTIVRYHCALFFGSFIHYFKTRLWFVMLIEMLKGKDLNRILGNWVAREWEAYGRTLDVGGDGKSSYWRFIRHARWHRLVTADIDPAVKPDVVINLDTEILPFAEGYFDTAIMNNVLEHVEKPQEVLHKVRQVLRKEGMLYGIVPFLVNVHPNPNDYTRFTRQGLEQMLKNSGFANIDIKPVGRGPFVASYYQSEFMVPRILKLILLPLVLLLDRVLLSLRPYYREKFPLSYAFTARR